MGVNLRDLGKFVLNALKSKRVLEEAGKVAVESIKKRTRLGKAVIEDEGAAVSLPKLKNKTKKNRKAIKKDPTKVLDEAFTPSKSNFTLTGHTVDSIRYGVGQGKILIDLDNEYARIKAENALKIDSGYQFMNLSRAEVNRMIKVMSEEIVNILNKIKIDKL